MKTSEKIVIGEYLLIAGLGMIAFGRGGLLLCERVTKLERQQKVLDEALKATIKELQHIKKHS